MASVFHALVVEDEAPVRRLTIRALAREGFECDPAEDGVEALERCKERDYDVVITDLRMPRMHGHALAVELLKKKNPPGIVVLTGVIEPRLAKDLTVRGVDEIMFKPVDYKELSNRIAAVIEKRRHRNAQDEEEEQQKKKKPQANANAVPRVTRREIDCKIVMASHILPLTTCPMEVYRVADSDKYGAKQLAEIIQVDGSLSSEVLRLVNSPFYNPSGQHVVELDEAVKRLGRKRIAELAFVIGSLANVTNEVLSWMDPAAAWSDCMGTASAVELLDCDKSDRTVKRSLILAGAMNILGRVFLASNYPEHYDRMLKQCGSEKESLVHAEQEVFPDPHSRVMARLLEKWEVPTEVYQPLHYYSDPYPNVARLPDPLCAHVQMLKVANLVGKLATDQWKAWDLVELPGESVYTRLKLRGDFKIIDQTRQAMMMIRSEMKPRVPAGMAGGPPEVPPEWTLKYIDLLDRPRDFLRDIVESMGIEVVRITKDFESVKGNVLINGLDVPIAKSLRVLEMRSANLYVVTSTDQMETTERCAGGIAIPCSYGKLKAFCVTASSKKQEMTPS